MYQVQYMIWKSPKSGLFTQIFPSFVNLVLKWSSNYANFALHGFCFPPSIRADRGLPVHTGAPLRLCQEGCREQASSAISQPSWVCKSLFLIIQMLLVSLRRVRRTLCKISMGFGCTPRTPSNGAPDILGELWLDAMCDGGKKDVKVEIIMQI